MAAPRSSCRVARRPSRPATISPIATASARPCSKAFSGWPPPPISWWSKARASAEVNLRGRRSRHMICARRQCSGHPHRRHPSWRRHRIAGRDIRGPRPSDAALIRAFLVNNFHGDPSLFDDGRKSSKAGPACPVSGSSRIGTTPANCRPRTAWRSTTIVYPMKDPCPHRRPAPGTHRQFRRSRPADARDLDHRRIRPAGRRRRRTPTS